MFSFERQAFWGTLAEVGLRFERAGALAEGDMIRLGGMELEVERVEAFPRRLWLSDGRTRYVLEDGMRVRWEALDPHSAQRSGEWPWRVHMGDAPDIQQAAAGRVREKDGATVLWVVAEEGAAPREWGPGQGLWMPFGGFVGFNERMERDQVHLTSFTRGGIHFQDGSSYVGEMLHVTLVGKNNDVIRWESNALRFVWNGQEMEGVRDVSVPMRGNGPWEVFYKDAQGEMRREALTGHSAGFGAPPLGLAREGKVVAALHCARYDGAVLVEWREGIPIEAMNSPAQAYGNSAVQWWGERDAIYYRQNAKEPRYRDRVHDGPTRQAPLDAQGNRVYTGYTGLDGGTIRFDLARNDERAFVWNVEEHAIPYRQWTYDQLAPGRAIAGEFAAAFDELWPIPARDYLNVSWRIGRVMEGGMALAVYDEAGRRRAIPLQAGAEARQYEATLDLRRLGLEAGVYLLTLEAVDAQGRPTQRLDGRTFTVAPL